MHFIELEKLHYSDIKSLKRSDRWIAYFSKKVTEADRKELAEMEPMIKEAMEQDMIFLHNPQLHREYEAREKAVKDRISQIITAKEEEKVSIAKKMLQHRENKTYVSEITGLSLSKVNELEKFLSLKE